MSARASGDLDVLRRLLAGAVFRPPLRVVRVAFFFVPRFADPFVVLVALFAVLRACLRERLPVCRVRRAALFFVRLAAVRALRAALFVVVVAFFAGMSCSSTLGFATRPGLPREHARMGAPGPQSPDRVLRPEQASCAFGDVSRRGSRENNRVDASPPASFPATILRSTDAK
jgi:hypothetical protein